MNFAAESHVDNSIQSPEIFVETNVQGTLNLLQSSRELEVDRFLQVSTDEVYGSLGKTGCFYETTPLCPNSPYSASKASADLLVRAYYETYKMPVLITRCSNNYGPYQYPEKLIPFFISQLLKGKKVNIITNGGFEVKQMSAAEREAFMSALLDRVLELRRKRKEVDSHAI